VTFNPLELLFRVSLIYLGIIIGILLKNYLFNNEEGPARLIIQVLLYTIFPFLVLSAVFNADITSNSLILVFTVIFTTIVVCSGLIAVWWYTKAHPLENHTKGSAYMTVGFPNSIFLPFPLIIMLFGIDGLVTATIMAVTILILTPIRVIEFL
jgi:predicted permease